MGESQIARDIFDTPWKLASELQRLLALPYVRFYFALNGVAWGRGWRIYGCPIIQRHRTSHLEIGRGLCLRSFPSSNPLGPYRPVILSTRSRNAVLRIGDDVGITGGTLCAARRIEVGDRVLIGANAIIVDTDFHPIDPAQRRQAPQDGAVDPVIIGDDVFIGMNSLILRGVHIGRGSVIGAGSVVTTSVPPGVLCAGNPARVVRPLKG
jgi:acetyltransferase-like isoleucine patch superfamily enzyme